MCTTMNKVTNYNLPMSPFGGIDAICPRLYTRTRCLLDCVKEELSRNILMTKANISSIMKLYDLIYPAK